jgi:hypothetical protein
MRRVQIADLAMDGRRSNQAGEPTPPVARLSSSEIGLAILKRESSHVDQIDNSVPCAPLRLRAGEDRHVAVAGIRVAYCGGAVVRD